MIHLPAEDAAGASAVPEVVLLRQEDHQVIMPLADWAEILLFLLECGWQPHVPVSQFTEVELQVSAADARELALVGRIVLEEAAKNQRGALSIDCNLDGLQDILAIAQKGPFVVARAPRDAEPDADR